MRDWPRESASFGSDEGIGLKAMGRLIFVDCEALFGVGAPSVGDMTEFGAVDVNARKEGNVETFQGTDLNRGQVPPVPRACRQDCRFMS